MATEKDIHAAADAIIAEGGHPTLITVRARLGGGSFSSIGPALKRWRQQQAEKSPREATPPPMPEAVGQKMRALWDEAVTLARAELQAERDRLAVERREIELEKQEAAELADQLANELDEARAQLVRLEGADRRFDEAKAEAGKVLDELTRVRAEAERARIAEQACQARLEAAAREMDDLRQRTKEAEARANKAAEEAAEWRGRLGVFEGKAAAPARRGKTTKVLEAD